eukprot:2527769-Rhodomonas_salina.2
MLRWVSPRLELDGAPSAEKSWPSRIVATSCATSSVGAGAARPRAMGDDVKADNAEKCAEYGCSRLHAERRLHNPTAPTFQVAARHRAGPVFRTRCVDHGCAAEDEGQKGWIVWKKSLA